MENIQSKSSLINKFLSYKQRINNSDTLNYFFIFYAFSIPISGKITHLVFTLIIILWILEGDIKNKIISSLKNKFVQALFFFFILHILWIFSSDNIPFALATIKNSLLLLYPIIYITSIKKEFTFKILNGFIYAMMFSEITSYLIHFQIIPPIYNATIHDPVPFALSHTTYSLYLGLSIGLMLFISLNSKTTKILKIIYILFFITASINIFLIASRFGFLLYFISILIVLIYIYKKNIKKIFFLGIILTSAGYYLAYTFSQTFHNRIDQTMKSTQLVIEQKNFSTSLGIRVGNWYYSFFIIKDNFLFGVGDGDQISEFQKIVKKHKDPAEKALLHNLQNGIHSEIMDIFTKFGFIGFILYLNIFFQLSKTKPKNTIFDILKFLLIFIFLLSAIQGGAIVMAVKDLGKIFTLLSILIIINSFSTEKKGKTSSLS